MSHNHCNLPVSGVLEIALANEYFNSRRDPTFDFVNIYDPGQDCKLFLDSKDNFELIVPRLVDALENDTDVDDARLLLAQLKKLN